MALFSLEIQGDDLWRANAVLNAGGIPTIGEFPGSWGGGPPPPSLESLAAVVDAPGSDEAVGLVQERLPADGDYTVGPVESWPSS
jgi:hypothetical protein